MRTGGSLGRKPWGDQGWIGFAHRLTIECASLDDRRLRPLSRNTDRSVDSHDRGLLEQTAPFRQQGFHLLILGDAALVEREGRLINVLNTLDVPAGPLIVHLFL